MVLHLFKSALLCKDYAVNKTVNSQWSGDLSLNVFCYSRDTALKAACTIVSLSSTVSQSQTKSIDHVFDSSQNGSRLGVWHLETINYIFKDFIIFLQPSQTQDKLFFIWRVPCHITQDRKLLSPLISLYKLVSATSCTVSCLMSAVRYFPTSTYSDFEYHCFSSCWGCHHYDYGPEWPVCGGVRTSNR